MKDRRKAEHHDGHGALVIHDKLSQRRLVVTDPLLDFPNRLVNLRFAKTAPYTKYAPVAKDVRYILGNFRLDIHAIML